MSQARLPGSPAGTLRALLVEAFTDRPCAGNGAGVVLLRQRPGDRWLQAVARSLRQSETAFLLPASGEAGPNQWLLRWFTPTCEVPLCGHGTLAALLALGTWGQATAGVPVGFHTRSGLLRACLEPGSTAAGTVELPAGELLPAPVPDGLTDLVVRLLGAQVERFWRSTIGYGVALLGSQAGLETMASIAADLPADLRQGLVLMQALEGSGARPQVGLQPADYQLRFFAPGLGIDEDPVTGSAHALVASYWMERFNRSPVRGWQCSDRPGGMVCSRRLSGMIALSGQGHVLWEGCLSALPDRFGESADDRGWPSAVVPDAT